MSIKETPRSSDENLTASSDSFWEVGNYRRTVKRIDDGAKLCDEFMKLIAERAEIEAKYSNKLKNWAKKWEEAIKLGPEYNTMETAMKGTIDEANSRSTVHTKCRDDLMNDVYEFVKKWKTDNYHKSLFQWKETKEAEDGFSKAQKPWAKFLMKVMRSKKAYHAAAKSKEQAEKAVTDATNDPNFPQDKLRKLEDVADKKRDEMEKAKQKYDRRIDEITTDHNSDYAEGMTRQFDRCQEFEEKRLEFMKETLMRYHTCLDISRQQDFQDLFLQMSATFQLANSQQDLEWWSRNHGTAMPHNWPIFEEHFESHTTHHKGVQSRILKLLKTRQKDFASELMTAYSDLKSDSNGSILSNSKEGSIDSSCSSDSDALQDIAEVSEYGISDFKTFGSHDNMVIKSKRTWSDANINRKYSADSNNNDVTLLDISDNAQYDPESSNNKACTINTTSVSYLLDRQGSIDSDDTKNNSDSLLDIVQAADDSFPEFTTFGFKTVVTKYGVRQEYDPNAVPQKPEKLQYVANSNQVPLTGYKPVETDAARPPSPPPSYSGAYMNDDSEEHQYSTVNKQYSTPKPPVIGEPQYDHPNPFGNENEVEAPDEWDEPPPAPMDIGVPVRALYDYQKVEEDELTFYAGDILTKLSEVDDQGWCLGRFQGQEGLIPADYVEAV